MKESDQKRRKAETRLARRQEKQAKREARKDAPAPLGPENPPR